ncbi:MAG TPA: peptidase, partial [Bacteroidota bacterium]
DKLVTTTWKAARGAGGRAEVQRVVDNTVLYHLMSLAANENAATQARALASTTIDELKSWMTQKLKTLKDPNQRAHLAFAAAQIAKFQENPKALPLPKPAEPPPGAPIGMDECSWE